MVYKIGLAQNPKLGRVRSSENAIGLQILSEGRDRTSNQRLRDFLDFFRMKFLFEF